MQTVAINIFSLSELTDAAKEAAREWYRTNVACEGQWYESVYEDAASVADILGIDLRTRKVAFRNGETRYDGINIMFSGFSCQGDGAQFVGSYCYAKGASKEIREYAPQDEELHRIADELQAIQRKHFYRIAATVQHSGHYSHEYCTDIDVNLGDYKYPSLDVQKEVAETLRSFMRWIYRSLEKEYDWKRSDEVVDEEIEANDFKFTDNGKRSVGIGTLQ